MKRINFTLCALIAVIISACSGNGKLQQYVENANINLAGQQIEGGYIEGVSLSGDTVVFTYVYPDVEAIDDYLDPSSAEYSEMHQALVDEIKSDLDANDEESRAIHDAHATLKYVFRYANGTVTFTYTPED